MLRPRFRFASLYLVPAMIVLAESGAAAPRSPIMFSCRWVPSAHQRTPPMIEIHLDSLAANTLRRVEVQVRDPIGVTADRGGDVVLSGSVEGATGGCAIGADMIAVRLSGSTGSGAFIGVISSGPVEIQLRTTEGKGLSAIRLGPGQRGSLSAGR